MNNRVQTPPKNITPASQFLNSNIHNKLKRAKSHPELFTSNSSDSDSETPKKGNNGIATSNSENQFISGKGKNGPRISEEFVDVTDIKNSILQNIKTKNTIQASESDFDKRFNAIAHHIIDEVIQVLSFVPRTPEMLSVIHYPNDLFKAMVRTGTQAADHPEDGYLPKKFIHIRNIGEANASAGHPLYGPQYDFTLVGSTVYIPICYTAKKQKCLGGDPLMKILNFYVKKGKVSNVICYLGRDGGDEANKEKMKNWLEQNEAAIAKLDNCQIVKHNDWINKSAYVTAEKVFLSRYLAKQTIVDALEEDIMKRLEAEKLIENKSPKLKSAPGKQQEELNLFQLDDDQTQNKEILLERLLNKVASGTVTRAGLDNLGIFAASTLKALNKGSRGNTPSPERAINASPSRTKTP